MTVLDKRPDFTHDCYKRFLLALCKGYRLTTFKEGRNLCETESNGLLIMRHDIDMDLEPAVTMASIEESVGVQSTYFFMVSCPLYDVFSKEGRRQVHQILSAKHHFGLHFDCAAYDDMSVDNLDRYVSMERRLLEGFFGHPIEAVSFHRPDSTVLSGVVLTDLPNSYEPVFRQKFEYFADSRGRWARGNPLDTDAFVDGKNLHICTHPIWWTVQPSSSFWLLADLIQRIGKRSEKYVSENCQVWNEGKMTDSGHTRS